MTSNVYEWIKKEESRKKTLTALKMPLTAKQLARKTGIPVETCSYLITKFALKGLVTCLNPEARNSRLYWLTEVGIGCQKRLCQEFGISYRECGLQRIDWALYGWLCYSHRSIVIKMLNKPMQPSEIKRQIRIQKPNTKISANNIRDVVKLLLEKELVQKVYVRKKAHPRYELTELGIKLRQLLIQAENNL